MSAQDKNFVAKTYYTTSSTSFSCVLDYPANCVNNGEVDLCFEFLFGSYSL